MLPSVEKKRKVIPPVYLLITLFTRNPMYMGMFLMLAGVAFLFGSIGALLPVFVFVLIIRNNFVLGEERFMKASFGQQYLDYKSTVRRWL